MRVLVLVPARGGSTGLPGKNLARVAGVSLTGQAVRVGRRFLHKEGLAGTVLIDTDDASIAEEAVSWGAEAPFLRPAELALDTTPMIATVLHALERLEERGQRHDAVVLLQPTSPLRTVEDVVAVWKAFVDRPQSAVAIVGSEHPAEHALRLDDAGRVDWAFADRDPAVNRQELPLSYRPTGSVYVSSTDFLRRHRAFIVPGESVGVVLPRSRSIDVDAPEDLELARAIANAKPTRDVVFGDRPVGSGAPCYVIAEAGVNHNGDVDRAHRLVDIAATAGADAVKFQTFDPSRLVSNGAMMADYQAENIGHRGGQAEMLAALVLPASAYADLVAHARERGVEFLSSPFDEQSADFLEELGVVAFKTGSGELTHHPFLRHVARKGRPLIVSTGMATLQEVGAALEVIEDSGSPPVVLLHCVTNSPASPADCNLRAMSSLRAFSGRPTGWSDHTEGIAVATAAVALGASIVEKHFTEDRGLPGPDHRASLEPDELGSLVRAIRMVESSLGDGVKVPRPSEAPLARVARRSLHARRALRRGDVIAAEDLVVLRPSTGLAPSQFDAVVGRTVAVDVAAGEPLLDVHLD